MIRWFTPAALLVVSLVSAPAGAQSGTVTGTVTDETGGVLPGVGVDLRSVASGALLESVTGMDGGYRFENVPAGAAELTFRLINFSTVRRDITVPTSGTEIANALMLIAMSADIVITAPRTFRNLAEIENPGGLQRLRRRGIGHRLLLRVPSARRAGRRG
jgi:iron complex outermembrane receptor protein